MAIAHSGTERFRRLSARLLFTASAAWIAGTALLVLGIWVPGLPSPQALVLLGFAKPPGWMAAWAIAAAGIAFASSRRLTPRVGRAFAVAGLVTAFALAAVTAGQLYVADRHGADVPLSAAFAPRARATADETLEVPTADGRRLRVDVYRPPGVRDSLAPVVIYVHGGGWIAGDRTEGAAALRFFASHGYVGIAMDYALATADRPTWDLAARDVGCALAWAARNASRYGGDGGRMYVFGASAGGALALTASYASASGSATSSCGDEVPKVRAVGAFAPAVDPVSLYANRDPLFGRRSRLMVTRYLGGTPAARPDRARAVSPASWVTAAAPPALMVLAGEDCLLPMDGPMSFASLARQAGASVETVTLPGADHFADNVVMEATLRLVLRHFRAH